MGRQVLTAITGATISSIIMAMVLPGGIALMAASESQHFYMRGFQTASLAVVGIMIAGAIIVVFHRSMIQTKTRHGSKRAPRLLTIQPEISDRHEKAPVKPPGLFIWVKSWTAAPIRTDSTARKHPCPARSSGVGRS